MKEASWDSTDDGWTASQRVDSWSKGLKASDQNGAALLERYRFGICLKTLLMIDLWQRSDENECRSGFRLGLSLGLLPGNFGWKLYWKLG